MLKVGLLINPLAGIGGAVALKGSDGDDIVNTALSLGAQRKAGQRALMAVQTVSSEVIEWLTVSGEMGQRVLQQTGHPHRVICQVGDHTHAKDTVKAVRALCEAGIDLLLFAGGDGTARDVHDALRANNMDERLPVIGIPAGCKIHSAVYAITPVHAGELLQSLADGKMMSKITAEVMDLDEQAFRAGQVRSRCYGYLQVPVDDYRMEVSKQGGVTQQAGIIEDIAAEVVENMDDETVYIIGSGSTTQAIMQQLDLPDTLLGVDVVLDQQLLASDVTERQLLELLDMHSNRPLKMIITVIGGQGHIFGRGNQQLGPDVIRRVGRKNILVVASREKLQTLPDTVLIADTGEPELDRELAGLVSVITGYQQQTLVRIGR